MAFFYEFHKNSTDRESRDGFKILLIRLAILMLGIKLTKDEYDYLYSISFLTKEQRNTLFSNVKYDDNQYSLKISENQADELRDVCGGQLQLIGFDEKYESTPEGKILESLIDKFFTG